MTTEVQIDEQVAANAEQMQRGRPFQKGQSGILPVRNPARVIMPPD